MLKEATTENLPSISNSWSYYFGKVTGSYKKHLENEAEIEKTCSCLLGKACLENDF